MKLLTHRWMVIAMCGGFAASAYSAGSDYSSKKLNPYHVNELNKQIQKSAAEVLACKDDETRCLRQQELCQKLIQVEKYDEALELARNIHMTDNINAERRAVHHYLVAEIYARKMRNATDAASMERNHGMALETAKEVIERKYPSKWGVSDQAKSLVSELQSPQFLQEARLRLSGRSGALDQSREAMANAQTAYMERAVSSKGGAIPSAGNSARSSGGGLFSGIAKKVTGRDSEAKVESQPVKKAQPQRAVTRLQAAPTRETIKTPFGQVSGDNSQPLRYPAATVANQNNSVRFENGDRVTFSNQTPQLVGNGPTALSNPGRSGTQVAAPTVQQATAQGALVQRVQSARPQGANSLLSGRRTGSRPGETYAVGQAPAQGKI